MLIYPVPFNTQGGCVRLRVDVGIDPYIETIRAFHSAYRSGSEGGGRLVAAPTVSTLLVEWNAPQTECRGRCPHRPARWVSIRTPMNGEMSIYPVPFNVQVCRVGVRVDVGIDPYIETIHACHSTHRVIAWGCGRLVAAPTGGAGRVPFNQTPWFLPQKRYRAGQGTNRIRKKPKASLKKERCV